jgi:Tol biopolymer transport system component
MSWKLRLFRSWVALVLVVATGIVFTTATATELVAPKEMHFYQDVAWSPDGRWIAYSELDMTGGAFRDENWTVHVARADGTDRVRIAGHAMYVSWSPDGRNLAYGSGAGGQWDIYAVNIADFESAGAPPVRITTDSTDERQPSWSPEGERIAFVSERNGSADIFVLNMRTDITVRVTSDSLSDYNPQWSPDGRRLVFFREMARGADNIMVATADGSGMYAVTSDSALDIYPSFTSDTTIAFSRSEGEDRNRLVEVSLDGSHRRYVAKVGTFFARWSPDGRQIAFISGRWPSSAIYIMSADGSKVEKIIN